jgi:hypothetical protein
MAVLEASRVACKEEKLGRATTASDKMVVVVARSRLLPALLVSW